MKTKTMDSNVFITDIKVNRIFNLLDVDIPISEDEKKHLIITGKNGSGKTVIVNAMLECLQMIVEEHSPLTSDKNVYKYRSSKYLNTLHNPNAPIEFFGMSLLNDEKYGRAINGDNYNNKTVFLLDSSLSAGGVNIAFNNLQNIWNLYHRDDFIIAFYGAKRNLNISVINSPEKPDWDNIRQIKTDGNSELLKFLVDCKVMESFARNEFNFPDASAVKDWFIDFENILKKIFQDNDLKLQFEYKDYSFTVIDSKGNKSPLTKLSDGYSAVIDIVTDLILKMQLNKGGLTRVYEKQGIVIIDEIETHLHLELQKLVLPILTTVFPNIQFIVTTHSPFVLNSINNAVAFDLETRKPIDELTEYSYEALAEGYFGINTDSSYVRMKLDRLKALLKKEDWNESEKEEVRNIKRDFDKMPESFSPQTKGEYLNIII